MRCTTSCIHVVVPSALRASFAEEHYCCPVNPLSLRERAGERGPISANLLILHPLILSFSRREKERLVPDGVTGIHVWRTVMTCLSGLIQVVKNNSDKVNESAVEIHGSTNFAENRERFERSAPLFKIAASDFVEPD